MAFSSNQQDSLPSEAVTSGDALDLGAPQLKVRRKLRHLIDNAAKVLIAIGGVSVIVAILLIFAGVALFFLLPLIDTKPEGRKGKIITACAFLLVVYAVIMSVWSLQTPAKPEADKLVPSPANIKESTAIYVFLGWMWLSIVVLIYFLRLKVKEIDRLYWSRFFSPEKS